MVFSTISSDFPSESREGMRTYPYSGWYKVTPTHQKMPSAIRANKEGNLVVANCYNIRFYKNDSELFLTNGV